ncbi:hypothetical protein GN244_ATG18675 [Phytophthora infestans]|uniref:Uncharacterized protein n=1 Tax=Phytophthora infestans TaxID=4787 RepID=A0A833RZ12_PHYIN|nr:hypothetical protein GN244_ATG18675 [Phytophthora infestans]KAF4138934.1 hypothetical protein GN958_ATG11891 [Phytophthora infestans]
MKHARALLLRLLPSFKVCRFYSVDETRTLKVAAALSFCVTAAPCLRLLSVATAPRALAAPGRQGKARLSGTAADLRKGPKATDIELELRATRSMTR